MSVVKLNTAQVGAPATGGSEGGSGLGTLAVIAVIGLAIWGAITYFGKKKEEPAVEEQAEAETE